MSRTIVVMPGDGIGRHVVPEALRVLAATGFDATYEPAEVGWDCWRRDGDALPARTLELLRAHRLGLYGANTSKPHAEAMSELAPALRARTPPPRYESPVLRMRRGLDLHTAVRPCRSLPGHPRAYVRRGAAGALESPSIDVTLFVQNTECHYAGVEWRAPPPALRAALATHPNFAPFSGVAPEDLAVSLRVVTRAAALRTARAAFAFASAHGFDRVTLCDKWGVMTETASLMLEAAEAARAEHPGVAIQRTNIDAQVLLLQRRPEDFHVLFASALVGDILSDACAGLVGGLGFAPVANLGEACAVFEPAHGSAPKYGAHDPPVANPVAAILAAAMLLDHVGEAVRAARIRGAILRAMTEGALRTFDVLGVPAGSPGTQGTRDATEEIIARL